MNGMYHFLIYLYYNTFCYIFIIFYGITQSQCMWFIYQFLKWYYLVILDTESNECILFFIIIHFMECTMFKKIMGYKYIYCLLQLLLWYYPMYFLKYYWHTLWYFFIIFLFCFSFFFIRLFYYVINGTIQWYYFIIIIIIIIIINCCCWSSWV